MCIPSQKIDVLIEIEGNYEQNSFRQKFIFIFDGFSSFRQRFQSAIEITLIPFRLECV